MSNAFLRSVGTFLTCFILILSHSKSMAGDANLPTTEQFNSALSTCAVGAKISIKADLIGSISKIYNGDRVNGALTFITESKLLELFAAPDRPKVYELYQKCIVQILRVQGSELDKGWLQPAGLTTPETGCKATQINQDDILLALGTSGVLVSKSIGSGKSIAIQIGQCPLLSIGIGENGALIDADIYNDAGELIGKIRDNGWQFKRNDLITIQKSGDLSNLVVHDENNIERLNIRYMNTNSFKVRGVFTCPKPLNKSIEITEGTIKFPGNIVVMKSCSGHSAFGFVLQ